MTNTLQNRAVELGLNPTDTQAQLLRSMLEGPTVLQRLLALSATPVTSPAQAAAFLDKHWLRLVPYMFQKGHGRSPKAMEDLILLLARGPLDEFRLDFAAQCSFTTGHQVQLPIPGLGPVAVADRVALEIARLGMKHSGGFGLIATATGFEVAIDFEPISAPSRPTAPQVTTAKTVANPSVTKPAKHSAPTTKPKQVRPPRAKGMTARDFLTYFNNKVTAHLQQQLAVSRQFTTTRFADLSGWGVSGGLPSLPRRR
jgi:hypothetical protein